MFPRVCITLQGLDFMLYHRQYAFLFPLVLEKSIKKWSLVTSTGQYVSQRNFLSHSRIKWVGFWDYWKLQINGTIFRSITARKTEMVHFCWESQWKQERQKWETIIRERRDRKLKKGMRKKQERQREVMMDFHVVADWKRNDTDENYMWHKIKNSLKSLLMGEP